MVRAAGSLLLADCAQSAGKIAAARCRFHRRLRRTSSAGRRASARCWSRIWRRWSRVGGQEKGYRRGTAGCARRRWAWRRRLQRGPYDMRCRARRAAPSGSRMESRRRAASSSREDAPRIPTIGAYRNAGRRPALACWSSSTSPELRFRREAPARRASMKPSGVLAAMGVPPKSPAASSASASGRHTSEADVERFLGEWRRNRRTAPRRSAA